MSHHSVKEYGISQKLQETALSCFFTFERIGNQFLIESCILYLLDFNCGEISVPPNFEEYPLLQYSSRDWMDHLKLVENDTEDTPIQRLLFRLFDTSSLNPYTNWLNSWNPDWLALGNQLTMSVLRFQDLKRSASLLPQPLYFAATLGNLPLLRCLFEQGCDIFAREGYYGLAFAAAAFHGDVAIVQFFLENGADPNLHGLKFGSVLQTAAASGSTAVVQTLLDTGVDVNAQGGEYNTALIEAASLEHDARVKLLIKHGADLNIGSKYHGSSLYQAASTGDTKMVITLLGAGADINHIGVSDGTPLYAAAMSGSLSLIQTLLRRGAEVHKGGPWHLGYPLVAAAKNGNAQVVRTLLRAGADPNISFAPLTAAIESGDMPTFLAILDGGANLNTPGTTYMNPFHAAIWTG